MLHWRFYIFWVLSHYPCTVESALIIVCVVFGNMFLMNRGKPPMHTSAASWICESYWPWKATSSPFPCEEELIMQNDDTSSSVTDITDDHSDRNFKQEDAMEKARRFLVWFAAFLAILGFFAFFVTRDFRILVGDSVFVIPILAVYAYYFPRRDAH